MKIETGLAPAKLTGKLVLKNVSADQTLRLVGGKIAPTK
jgi:hypothetical protein